MRLFEPKGEYDGEAVYILGDKVLQIGTNPSSRDTVAKVRRIVDKWLKRMRAMAWKSWLRFAP